MGLKEIWLRDCGLSKSLVVDSCDHVNDPPVSINFWEFLDKTQ
jgi:hypothetical protein